MTLVHEQAADLGPRHGRYHENSLRALVSQTRVQTRRILLRWARDLTTVIESLVLPILCLLRRLWVVPVHRASGVLSRIVAETVRIVITTLVVLAVGLMLGFRFHQGILASLTWFVVPLIFGLACTTLITVVALYAANNFLLETVTLVHILLVVFSTGFLPVDQFPTWIQPIVAHQPMSYAIEAMRGLSMGGPVRWPMIATLLWAGGITAVCVVPALRGYRRASTC
jgi:ABC-2 type transport system permease protein